MAAFDTTRPVAAFSAGRFQHVIQNMVGAFAAWNDARVTRNALSHLSDRELEDIGMTRADIAQIKM
jgi:uncharacterized protein YjiS (DUF1127 family)